MSSAVSLPEVFLLVLDRGFEGYNLYTHYKHGDLNWFGLSLACIWMPGILQILYWVSQLQCFCGELTLKSKTFWKEMFLGITFPASIIFRLGAPCIKKNYAQLRVIRSLQTFAESVPQIILQTYIILRTWQGIGYDWIHVACVVTSILMVAKNSAEHHYHEVSGKKKIPSTKEVLVSFLYYIFNVPARIVPLAIIFANFQLYGLFLVFALFFTNIAVASIILTKNYWVKTIWTSIAAIAAPASFVSVHTIEIYKTSLAKTPEERFRNFYVANSFAFIFWSLVATASLNVLSAYDIIAFQELDLGVLTFGVTIGGLPIMGVGSFCWVAFSSIMTICVIIELLRQ